MIIVVLIIWAVLGFLLGGKLTEMGIINENMEFSKGMVLSFICGPICLMAWLFGAMIGIIGVIAEIISYFNDK